MSNSLLHKLEAFFDFAGIYNNRHKLTPNLDAQYGSPKQSYEENEGGVLLLDGNSNVHYTDNSNTDSYFEPGTGDWAIYVRCRLDAIGTRNYVVSKALSGPSVERWAVAADRAFASPDNDSSTLRQVDVSNPPLGQWVDIVVNFDRDGNIEYWRDGVLLGTVNFAADAAEEYSSALDLVIGNYNNASGSGTSLPGTDYGWNGAISKVMMWKRVLSYDEISNINALSNYVLVDNGYLDYENLVAFQEQTYNYYQALYQRPQQLNKPTGEVTIDWSHPAAKGLFASFDFIEGQEITRDTTNNYSPTVSGTTVFKKRARLVSNGDNVTDQIDLGSLPNTDKFSFTNDGTIITRVKLDTGTLTNLYPVIFSRGDAASDFLYFCYNDSVDQWQFNVASSSTEQQSVVSESLAQAQGVWRDLAVTISGSSYTIYVKGVGSGSNTNTIPTGTYSTVIANSEVATDRQWDGEIEYIHFYDHALTESEIKDHWQNPYAYLKSANIYEEYNFFEVSAEAPASDGNIAATTAHLIMDGLTATILRLKKIASTTKNLLLTGQTATFNNAYGRINPKIGIKWQRFYGYQTFVIGVEWRTAETPVSDMAVTIEWVGETADLYININWFVEEVQTIGPINIEWEGSVAGYPDYPAQNEVWDLTITFTNPEDATDTLDISADLIGDITIEYEENVSAIANFAVIPNTNYTYNGTNIDVLSFMNYIVNIKVRTTVGATYKEVNRFNGWVMDADYDADEKKLYFSATSDLQNIFEKRSKESINNLLTSAKYKVNSTVAADGANTPSNWSFWWSEYVFNKETNGWEYMQDLLSTAPVVISTSRGDRNEVIITHIDDSNLPTLSYTDANRFNNTLEITRANRRDLVNYVQINMDYLNYKLRHKIIGFKIDARVSPCDLWNYSISALTKQDVESAISSLSWDLYGQPTYQPYVNGSGTGFVSCSAYGSVTSSGAFRVLPPIPNSDGNKIIEAHFQLYKKWVLTSKENYQITVYSKSSIGNIPSKAHPTRVFKTDLDFGVESQYDVTYWENEPIQTNLTVGDYEYDTRNEDHDGNQAALELAQKTAINHAKVAIKKSHRQNTVDFRIPFDLRMDLNRNVTVTADYMSANGKVRRYVDYFNIETGETYQDVQLALSLHGGVGTTEKNTAKVEAPTSTGFTQPQGNDLYKKNARSSNYEYQDLHLYLGGMSYKYGYYNGYSDCVNGDIDQCNAGWYANSTRKGAEVEYYYAHNNAVSTSKANQKYSSGWMYGGTTGIYRNDHPDHWLFNSTGVILKTPEILSDEVVQVDLQTQDEFDTYIREDTLTLSI